MCWTLMGNFQYHNRAEKLLFVFASVNSSKYTQKLIISFNFNISVYFEYKLQGFLQYQQNIMQLFESPTVNELVNDKVFIIIFES